jgi:hypothetical protein
LIQRIDFHNNLKNKELPKRFFENKSNDYNRTDFVKPNYDKSNYSASAFNSYNNNDNKIIKDNSLLKKISKMNKIPLEENFNINNKPETIIIPDVDDDNNNKSKYIIIPDDESNINKEDDVFNNSGKRLREESNLNINKNSRRKIDISDDNNNNNNNQITTTLFDYSNLVLPSHNSLSLLIKFYKRGTIYSKTGCLYDKDKHPVIQFKNPEDIFSKLFQIPFK